VLIHLRLPRTHALGYISGRAGGDAMHILDRATELYLSIDGGRAI
jgi:hypothetical protein